MKLTLKSLFPSSLFKKITLKAAILVGLVIFYLVIIFSNSREGIDTPQTMEDVKQMLDTEIKKTEVPKETEYASPSVEMTPPALSTPPTRAGPPIPAGPAGPAGPPTRAGPPIPAAPTPAGPAAPMVETLVSSSANSYSTY